MSRREDGVHSIHEILQRQVRLDEERDGAERFGLSDVALLTEIRQDDDRDGGGGLVLLQQFQHFEPLELGHDHVEEHEVQPLGARDAQRFLAVDRREHLEAVTPQPGFRRPP